MGAKYGETRLVSPTAEVVCLGLAAACSMYAMSFAVLEKHRLQPRAKSGVLSLEQMTS